MRKNSKSLVQSKHRTSEEDLTANIWPPPTPAGESELEKALRQQEELKAANSSAEIDKLIESSRLESQKNRKQTRILLLGQAESGKSTILKNFQLQYSPRAFQKEGQAWRAVIHLNLTCFVNFILDRIPNQAIGRNSATSSDEHIIEPDNELRRIKLQLRPLHQVEGILSRRMSVDKTPIRPVYPDLPWSSDGVFVRSGSGWKSLFGLRAQGSAVHDDIYETRQILDACKEDIRALWNHNAVVSAIQDHLIALQEQANFFLTDAVRVCSLDYEPTTDDILRARLGTLGIEEHHLIMETGLSEDKQDEFIIYDVGGSRSQRAAWASYFDDVSVMIFLVPISAFNQVLAEDRNINRLLDSFQLWKTICGSKYLSHINIILLLNKFDLLAQKLNSGIKFNKHVTSYKEQPNDAEHVAKYLKAKFFVIHKQLTPQRSLFCHITCAIDIQATSIVLSRIRETLLKLNLEKTDLI